MPAERSELLLKAHEVEGFLTGLGKGPVPFCVMAHGPDRGMVADALQRFAAATGVDRGDATATVILDGAAVASDPGRLWDELNGPGLFGGVRLIRLREATNDKRLAEAIAGALADPPTGAHLALEAGELRRGAALLKAFDRTRSGCALPCYPDDQRAVAGLIDSAFAGAGIALDADAKDMLVSALGGDRLQSKAELDKLLLYAEGSERVTLADVEAVVSDAATGGADLVVDAALSGDRAGLDAQLTRFLAARASPFLLLRDLVGALQTIERAQADGGGPGTVVRRLEAMGPRIHFRRLPHLKRAAQRLDPDRTARLLNEAAEAVLMSRKRAALEMEIVSRLVMRVAA